VLGLTRVLAKDNIRVNCLCPGLIWTDMMKQLNNSGQPELSKERLLGQVYSRRYGTVEEMANIVNFLMSSESSYITGQAIEADGMWAI
jgi:3-oxoacyl-[acyl-carrier protein] reductase